MDILLRSFSPPPLAACGDSGLTDISAPVTGSQVLFYNDALGSPGVNFFADTLKLTGTLTSAGAPSPSGTNYGQIAAGGDYTQAPPGQYALSGRLSDTTAALQNTMVSSVSTTLAGGKSYSYFQAGPYDATAKHADAFVVEDPIPSTWDYTVANIRFVNAIYNASPGTLTLVNSDTTIHPTPAPVVVGGATAYKSASAFVAVPPGTYAFTVTGLNAAKFVGSLVVSGGRYYTLSIRGDINVTSTKAATFPTFDFLANR